MFCHAYLICLLYNHTDWDKIVWGLDMFVFRASVHAIEWPRSSTLGISISDSVMDAVLICKDYLYKLK